MTHVYFFQSLISQRVEYKTFDALLTYNNFNLFTPEMRENCPLIDFWQQVIEMNICPYLSSPFIPIFSEGPC
jgi:hypothetical protein